MNQDLRSTVSQDDIPLFSDTLNECLLHPEKTVCVDLRRLRYDGSIFWIRWEFCALIEDGKITGLRGLGTDTSERKRAELERQEAREKLIRERSLLRTLVDNLPDAIYIKDTGSKYILTNRAMVNMIGANCEEETLGRSVSDFFDRSFSAKHIDNDKRIMSEGIPLFDHEEFIVNRKGEKKWILTTKIPLKEDNNRIVGLVGINRDITERKRLQDELAASTLAQQRNITEATILGQEKEKAEIGRELHDNINQILTTTKMYLDMALAEKEISEELTTKSLENISNVIEEIRTLSKSLVPPSLGDIGLKEAVSEMIKNLNKSGKIDIRLKTSGISKSILPGNVQLMIFRIIQEQVNNIIKHSKASAAEVKLIVAKDTLNITITDNGIGFDPKKRLKGIGLMNIVSRAEVHKGDVEIISSPGNGCTLKISIPI